MVLARFIKMRDTIKPSQVDIFDSKKCSSHCPLLWDTNRNQPLHIKHFLGTASMIQKFFEEKKTLLLLVSQTTTNQLSSVQAEFENTFEPFEARVFFPTKPIHWWFFSWRWMTWVSQNICKTQINYVFVHDGWLSDYFCFNCRRPYLSF